MGGARHGLGGAPEPHGSLEELRESARASPRPSPGGGETAGARGEVGAEPGAPRPVRGLGSGSDADRTSESSRDDSRAGYPRRDGERVHAGGAPPPTAKTKRRASSEA